VSTTGVGDFYERHPYPPAVDDLEAYRSIWDDRRRRTESHLMWPAAADRNDRSILVAGCGTVQAAHYAVRWPEADVVGIDVSARSVAITEALKQKHQLHNLQVRLLAVEDVAQLGRAFDHIVCTGVLHHLSDPDAGLRALRGVLAPGGALNMMLYAPYGRAGIYMIQDYCRRLGIGSTDADVRNLTVSLRDLPADHPLVPLLRNSPDFASAEGLADALLHPQDRAYSVPELFEFLERGGFHFGRWVRQAPYLPWCGAFLGAPHHERLSKMEAVDAYAAIELFRGTMARHAVIAYGDELGRDESVIDFGGEAWLRYVPIKLPDTVALCEKLPPGAAAVLINRNHTYTDLYLPIDERSGRVFAAIDGNCTIAEICAGAEDVEFARRFFRQLWHWDQIVFDTAS
jgi:SAM-dependent methyltransferase